MPINSWLFQADEYFAEAMEVLNREAIMAGETAAPKITMFDRIKRELDVVTRPFAGVKLVASSHKSKSPS